MRLIRQRLARLARWHLVSYSESEPAASQGYWHRWRCYSRARRDQQTCFDLLSWDMGQVVIALRLYCSCTSRSSSCGYIACVVHDPMIHSRKPANSSVLVSLPLSLYIHSPQKLWFLPHPSTQMAPRNSPLRLSRCR